MSGRTRFGSVGEDNKLILVSSISLRLISTQYFQSYLNSGTSPAVPYIVPKLMVYMIIFDTIS